jgi:hypothetical protein
MVEEMSGLPLDRLERILRRSLPVLQILGVLFFLLWAKDTDFMFGHFKGPPGYLIAAFVLAATSIAGRVYLCVRGCRSTALTPEDSGLDGEPTGEKPLWRKVLSVVLFLPSILIVLIALLGFVDSL